MDWERNTYSYDGDGNQVKWLIERRSEGRWGKDTMLLYEYLVNSAPVARADEAATDEEAAVEIEVLINDLDPDGDEVTLSIVALPVHGTAFVGGGASGAGGRTITYVPALDFSGTDVFTYGIADGRGGVAEAAVTVTVAGVNDAPSTPSILSPSDGATLLIGGAEEGVPADPATTITVAWEEAEDAEGDPLTSRWELALDPDFEGIIASPRPEVEAASKAELEVTYGMIAAALDEVGVELGGEVELFHRVVASDGQEETPGEGFRIKLVRGTLVAAEGEGEIPSEFALHAAYPNPFNPETTISFNVPESAHVTIAIYNSLGRQMVRLVDAAYAPGTYHVRWQAEETSSGVYFLRMEAAGETFTERVVLAR